MKNKSYTIKWKKEALKWLANKIDKITACKLYEQTNQDLANDPYGNGDPLVGEWKGYRSYRYMRRYRIIYKVTEREILVEIVKVAHRREVYD